MLRCVQGKRSLLASVQTALAECTSSLNASLNASLVGSHVDARDATAPPPPPAAAAAAAPPAPKPKQSKKRFKLPDTTPLVCKRAAMHWAVERALRGMRPGAVGDLEDQAFIASINAYAARIVPPLIFNKATIKHQNSYAESSDNPMPYTLADKDVGAGATETRKKFAEKCLLQLKRPPAGTKRPLWWSSETETESESDPDRAGPSSARRQRCF